MRHLCLTLALLVLAATAAAGTVPLRWPDAAPGGTCAGLSLQQCIDTVPVGAHLRVVRGSAPTPQYHAIPGTLTITRPLRLSVDPGVDAVLPEGADIICRPAAGQVGYCQIEGFVLRRGSILVESVDNQPGFVVIRRNRVGIPPRTQARAAIQVVVAGSRAATPAWEVDVDHNVLMSTGASGGNGIDIANVDDGFGAMNARVSDNLVESRHPQGMRSGIALTRQRGDEWRIERNLVRGPTDTTASSALIVFSQTLQSASSPVRIADQSRPSAQAAPRAAIAFSTCSRSRRGEFVSTADILSLSPYKTPERRSADATSQFFLLLRPAHGQSGPRSSALRDDRPRICYPHSMPLDVALGPEAG